jgi:tetratricopeptide (TPR) repeat protein
VLDRADAELARAATLDTAWPEVPLLQAAVAFSRARAAGGDRAAVAAAAHAGLQQVDAVLASDPRNARAHELRGQLVFYGILRSPTVGVREGEKLLQVAESSLVMAVRLDRQRAGAWATLSELHYRKPDLQAAALAAMTAYEADAYLANARSILVRLVSVAYDLEQYNEARAWCDRGRQRLPRDPFFSQCRLLIMWMRAAEGTPPDSAWQHAASYVERTGSDQRPFAEEMARVLVAGALARGQLKDSARVVLQSVRTDAVVDPHRELAGYAAAVRVILGDHDEAVRLLTDYLTANPSHRKGFATRTGWWWRDLQTHPKFTALIAGAR